METQERYKGASPNIIVKVGIIHDIIVPEDKVKL